MCGGLWVVYVMYVRNRWIINRDFYLLFRGGKLLWLSGWGIGYFGLFSVLGSDLLDGVILLVFFKEYFVGLWW